jgi:4-hydroxybenzoate polyprenyltransferase
MPLGDTDTVVANGSPVWSAAGSPDRRLAGAPAHPSPGSWVRAVVSLCRPSHWTKNLFVLIPILFGGGLLDPTCWVNALVTFGCFCLVSSAVYVFNDLLDAEADRTHPRKCTRPLAAGTIGPVAAAAVVVILVGVASVVAGVLLPWKVLALAGLYLANSLVYCLWLKHRVLVDVMVIAVGFVLRLLAGCAAVSVAPSGWIVVCGFSLALILGFGKRRAELTRLGAQGEYRATLKSYDLPKVDTLLAICTSVTLLAYMLYTLAPETVQRHNTENLVYTVPVVAYGLFRFLLVAQSGKGDGPTEILTRDKVFYLTGLAWAASVAVILYAR